MVDIDSGHSRGFGFDTLVNPEAMGHGIRDIDGEEINGKVDSVKSAKPGLAIEDPCDGYGRAKGNCKGETRLKGSCGCSTSSCACFSGGCRFPSYPDHGGSSCKKDDGKELYISLLDILPMDIISDILIRLPVKSLLCLKCVCKSLLTLISSSKFAQLHLRHCQSSISNRFLIFTGKTLPADYDLCYLDIDSPVPCVTKLPFPHELYKSHHDCIIVIGSCNGLVCLGTSDSRVVVVNPSTRTFFEIPKSRKPIPAGCCANTQFGFGYDGEKDDYKLVRIVNVTRLTFDKQYNEIMVYSLKAKTWRVIGGDFPWNVSCFESGVLIDNHLLHWNAYHRLRREKDVIFVFNLLSEQYSLLPVPQYPAGECNLMDDLGNLQGSLCLLVRNNDQKRGDVWVMKQYGVKESWVKLLTVSDLADTSSLCDSPIVYGQGGLEILLSFFNPPDYEGEYMRPASEYYSLCWYNLQNKTMRDFEPDVCLGFGRLAFCWVSLVSIPGGEHFNVGDTTK